MEWMIVFTTQDVAEAHIVAGRLEVEGVKSFIQRNTLASVYGMSFGPLSEVNIAVNPADYERALEILEPDELHTLTEGSEDVVYYDYHQDSQEDDSE